MAKCAICDGESVPGYDLCGACEAAARADEVDRESRFVRDGLAVAEEVFSATGFRISSAELLQLRRESIAAGRAGLEASAGKHEREIAKLVPIARLLSTRLSELTISEVRFVAVKLGLLDANEKNLSWLGAVMRRADLEATGRMRRSFLLSTHGRHQMVWTRGPES